MQRILRRIPMNSQLCAIWTFFIAIAIGTSIVMRFEQSAHLEERLSTADLATMQVRKLEDKLAQALSATYAVAALVKDHNGEVNNFASFGSHLLQYHAGISALYLAPDGVTREVVPPVWAKFGLGIDLFSDPARKTEALIAKNTNQLSLAGPLMLKRGSLGIIGRIPIFLKKENWFATKNKEIENPIATIM